MARSGRLVSDTSRHGSPMNGEFPSKRGYCVNIQERLDRGDVAILRAALDALDCQLAVLADTGQVVMANASWRQMAEKGSGCATQGAPGSNYFDVSRSAGLADEAREAVEGVRSLIRSEKADIRFKYPCVGPQGQDWFELNATHCDVRGARYVIIAHRNITQTKLSEERLQVRAENFEQMLDSAPHLLALVDRRGSVEYSNAAWVKRMGSGDGAMLEQEICRRIHPADREQWLTNWREAVRRELPYSVEHRMGAYDTLDFTWYLERGTPIRRRGNTVTHWLLSLTSVEEAKQREATLRAQLRRKDNLVSSILHELRGPLAPMGAALDLVARDKHENSNVSRSYSIIRRQLRQLSRLVDDLMDAAKSDREAPELKWSRVDVAEVLEAAVETTRPAMNRRHHHLAVAAPRSGLWIRGDAGRLVQVITNLLINAAKYTEPGGNIALIAERTENAVRIRVRDNGLGIAVEELKNIFDLFAQGSPRAPTGERGHGIGLAVAKQLVRLHGGQIWGSSDGPGKGSEFTVLLPAEPAVQELKGRAEMSQITGADHYANS